MDFVKNLSIPMLLKSKRFQVQVISVLVMVAIALYPDLEPHAAQLNASILAFVLFLTKGYSDQDKASAEAGVNKYNGDGQQTSA